MPASGKQQRNARSKHRAFFMPQRKPTENSLKAAAATADGL
jgi:hypothetical protein